MHEGIFGGITLRLTEGCISGAYDLTDVYGVIPYDHVEVYANSVQFSGDTDGCFDPDNEFEVFFDTSEYAIEDAILSALKFMLRDRASRNSEQIRSLEIENERLSELYLKCYFIP